MQPFLQHSWLEYGSEDAPWHSYRPRVVSERQSTHGSSAKYEFRPSSTWREILSSNERTRTYDVAATDGNANYNDDDDDDEVVPPATSRWRDILSSTSRKRTYGVANDDHNNNAPATDANVHNVSKLIF